MDDEGIALLTELVAEDPTTYETFNGEVDGTICFYCDARLHNAGDWIKGQYDWRINHEPDCPVQRARDYLRSRNAGG